MQKHTTLEHDIPLANSMIWKMQKNLYQLHGPSLWQSSLPFMATNNNNVAYSTAHFILNFVKDYEVQAPEAKWTIVTLGAGTGTLSYKLVQALNAKNDQRQHPIQLIMSDCVNQNISSWKKHAQLKPFIENNTIIPMKLDADQGMSGLSALQAFRSEHQITTPLIVIANYVFDTLPQSIFCIDHHDGVSLGLCSIKSKRHPKEASSPHTQDINALITEIRFDPISEPYSPDPDIHQYLKQQISQGFQGQILIPTVAMRCLANLKQIANGNLVLLAADKYMKPRQDLEFHHYMVDHGPTFSLPVDPFAITRPLNNSFTKTWLPENWTTNIMSISHICLNQPIALNHLQEFMQKSEHRNPSSFASETIRHIVGDTSDIKKNMSRTELFKHLEALRWDISALEMLSNSIPSYLTPNKQDQPSINHALHQFSKTDYMIPGHFNTIVILGFYCLRNRQYPLAHKLFSENIRVIGDNAAARLGLILTASKQFQVLVACKHVGILICLLRHKIHRQGLGLIWQHSRWHAITRYILIATIILICLYYFLSENIGISLYSSDLW